jgi:3-oxoacyl-[acyl-carrier protein] reductase
MKAALTNLTKGLAREYASRHVRFNTISPGLIFDEEGSAAQIRSDDRSYFDAMLAQIPMGRMGPP